MNQTLLTPETLRRIERLALIARRVQLGVSKGERQSKRKGTSAEFADYRNYVQGDDLRFVDWSIYARLGDLFLKLFREQEDLTLHLLVDSSLSMSFGTPSKIQFACRLAAALGYIGLVGYDRVSAEAFSGEKRQTLRPCRGKVSAGRFFSFLSEIETDGPTQLEDDCHSYLLRNRSKGIVILISDFFDPSGFEGSLRKLTISQSDVYAVHVMAPEEIDPQLSGDLKLIDSETETFVEISVNRGLLKQYQKNRDGFCDSIRRFCFGRNIGYYNVSSAAPIEQLTLEVLRKGGMLR